MTHHRVMWGMTRRLPRGGNGAQKLMTLSGELSGEQAAPGGGKGEGTETDDTSLICVHPTPHQDGCAGCSLPQQIVPPPPPHTHTPPATSLYSSVISRKPIVFNCVVLCYVPPLTSSVAVLPSSLYSQHNMAHIRTYRSCCQPQGQVGEACQPQGQG